MTVVGFTRRNTQPEPDVWQCRCGSFTFWLYSTGRAYCTECRQEAVSRFGCWEIPEKPQPDPSERNGNIVPLFRENPSPLLDADADADAT